MGSIADTADQAMDHVKETAANAAGHAKGSLMDFGTQVLKLVNTLRVQEMRGVDSVLDRVGLQRRESALRPVLWFAAGAVAAGAVVFILAPTSGKELRGRIANMLDRGRSKVKSVGTRTEGAVADEKKDAVVAKRTGPLDESAKRTNGEPNPQIR